MNNSIDLIWDIVELTTVEASDAPANSDLYAEKVDLVEKIAKRDPFAFYLYILDGYGPNGRIISDLVYAK